MCFRKCNIYRFIIICAFRILLHVVITLSVSDAPVALEILSSAFYADLDISTVSYYLFLKITLPFMISAVPFNAV